MITYELTQQRSNAAKMEWPDRDILEPFLYICGTPGKDFRGIMLDCFQDWFQVPPDKFSIIKEIIRSLHDASLLIDDIEDSSVVRRGKPVAHLIYGVAYTINSANYVYFLELQKCLTLGHASAITLFTTEMLRLHRGQGHDILWRDRCTCPTEQDYLNMVSDKTGGLFRLAIGLMEICSSNTSTGNEKLGCGSLLENMAHYFQIRDDYINLCR